MSGEPLYVDNLNPKGSFLLSSALYNIYSGLGIKVHPVYDQVFSKESLNRAFDKGKI